ncbi:SGNH/GDSL hydrolase family protein [Burkholderia cenocepacia]|uniref:SGNH/GDSL hydrolase family protein n=1 Tax=Burkholderia cenocepacia TaxID=95486 RepID=UPI001115713D|nr:SGNH/GDSL hydrolase family protein [Burkholderia cenocepacia]
MRSSQKRFFYVTITVAFIMLCLIAGLPKAFGQEVVSRKTNAPCFVMGDSVAQGIAAQLPQCSSNTKVGLNTVQALTRFKQIPPAQTVIVSLGINDRDYPGTRANLEAIRARIHAQNVIWILPPAILSFGIQKKKDALYVAMRNRDYMKNIDQTISADGIHPTNTGYKAIARQLGI